MSIPKVFFPTPHFSLLGPSVFFSSPNVFFSTTNFFFSTPHFSLLGPSIVFSSPNVFFSSNSVTLLARIFVSSPQYFTFAHL